MSIKTTLKLTALSALTALAYTSHAQAEGKLTVYCSVQKRSMRKSHASL